MTGVGRLAARIIGAGVLVLVLAGCEGPDPLKYSEWQAISDKESILALSATGETSFPKISRRTRSNASLIQELWRWRGGALIVVDLYSGSYFSSSFTSKDGLKKRVDFWRPLRGLGVSLQDKDIRYGVNAIGRMVYGLSRSKDKSRICMLFEQALRDENGGDAPVTANPTGGYITGYHCVKASGITESEFESEMLARLKAVYPR